MPFSPLYPELKKKNLFEEEGVRIICTQDFWPRRLSVGCVNEPSEGLSSYIGTWLIRMILPEQGPFADLCVNTSGARECNIVSLRAEIVYYLTPSGWSLCFQSSRCIVLCRLYERAKSYYIVLNHHDHRNKLTGGIRERGHAGQRSLSPSSPQMYPLSHVMIERSNYSMTFDRITSL